MATTALTPPTCTFWAGLGLSPGSPGTPVGRSLPCPSVPAPRPAPSSHLVYRGQLAPGHKDTLLAGDPVNMREIKKPAAWPGQTLSPTGGREPERTGLPHPAHHQPPAQNGKWLLWRHLPVCGPMPPPHKSIRDTSSPAAGAEGGSREETLQTQKQRHETALLATTRAPCTDPEAPGSGAARRPPAFEGRGWSALAGLTVGAVDAGVLVVTEEKAAVALTLVAAHGVDADLLAASVVVLTLVHICSKRRGKRSHLGREVRRSQQKAVEGVRPAGCRTILQTCPTAVPHGGSLNSSAWGYPTEADSHSGPGFPGAQHYSKHLTCFHSFNSHRNPAQQI